MKTANEYVETLWNLGEPAILQQKQWEDVVRDAMLDMRAECAKFGDKYLHDVFADIQRFEYDSSDELGIGESMQRYIKIE